MARVTYIAFLEATDDGYGVSFPDLDGCTSWGADQTQAVENAREALSLHLEGMAEDELEIPPPSDLKAVARKLAGAYFERREPTVYVAIDVEAPEAAERVNVYLNKGLLDRLDRYAKARGVNRSEFLALAARNYMAHEAALDLDDMTPDERAHVRELLLRRREESAGGGFQRQVHSNMRPGPARQG